MPSLPDSARSSVGLGLASVMTTVVAFGLATDVRSPNSSTSATLLVTFCCNDHTASEASNVWPFEKVTPDCSVRVTVSPSSEVFQLVASPG